MELQKHMPRAETASFWTDEKHVRFLNSMEASFVNAMLEKNSRLIRNLHRHLPETSESTTDLKPHRTSRKHALSDLMGRPARIEVRRTRRRPSQPYDSLEDQVVPQMEKQREDNDDDHEEQTSKV